FSVVYAVLLKPLPFTEPERLVKLSEYSTTQAMDPGRVSRGTFSDWQGRPRTIDSLAAYSTGGESLWTIGDRLQVVRVAAASPSLARVLEVQPVAGRWFSNEPASSVPPQLVISYAL